MWKIVYNLIYCVILNSLIMLYIFFKLYVYKLGGSVGFDIIIYCLI